MTNQERVNISIDRQLFVDDFWIDKSIGTTRQLHQSNRRDPVIEKDYPWEQGHVGAPTIAYDQDKYKMWYMCEDASVIGVSRHNYHKHAYAESDDGINWTKPFLRQTEFEGSKENNLFADNPGVVGLDKNPGAKEDEPFKAFKFNK